jgi:hypothetical protein
MMRWRIILLSVFFARNCGRHQGDAQSSRAIGELYSGKPALHLKLKMK